MSSQVDWQSGTTEFQWKEGPNKGKMEVFDKMVGEGEPGENGEKLVVFRSGAAVPFAEINQKVRRIRHKKDINFDLLKEFNEREKERKKKKAQKKQQKDPEAAAGMSKEKEIYDEETRKKLEEEEKKNPSEENGQEQESETAGTKEKGGSKKEPETTTDPVILFLRNQTNFVQHKTSIPLKIPKNEILNALGDSFNDDNINEKIRQVALEYFQSDEFFEFLKGEVDKYLDLDEEKETAENESESES